MSDSSEAVSLRRTSRIRKEPKYRLGESATSSSSLAAAAAASASSAAAGGSSSSSSQSSAGKSAAAAAITGGSAAAAAGAAAGAGAASSSAAGGKSRRTAAYKRQARQPHKSLPPCSCVQSLTWLFHRDQYYQLGDIVSVVDIDDDRRYYAQVRGLLQDEFLEKSCVLTWLVPTQLALPSGQFQPAAYILGPEEDLPRPLDTIDFECHCPADYYKRVSAPYPSAEEADAALTRGYVWTSLRHEMAAAAAAAAAATSAAPATAAVDKPLAAVAVGAATAAAD